MKKLRYFVGQYFVKTSFSQSLFRIGLQLIAVPIIYATCNHHVHELI